MISLVPSESWGGFKWVRASARKWGVGPCPAQCIWQGSGFAADQTNAMLAVVRADDESLVPPQAAGLALSVARPLPTDTALLGFGGSPVGGGDKNSRFAFFRHFCVGVVSLPSGRFVCVGITRRGVYCSRKNGFLRAGALRRRTRCSLLHTALFRRSCMGVVSLPSACVSCCRNAGRPRVTAAYSPFLCRRGARPVRAEYPLAGYTRHPIPQTRTQRLTRRNTAGSQGRW